MLYVPPTVDYCNNEPSVFLAGGISDCERWQERIVELLANSILAVLNPRRAAWNPKDQEAGKQQIAWEHRHLALATARLFWFPSQTVCPITLFELGGAMKSEGPLFVGMESGYQRRFDVEVQLQLARPEVKVVYTLEDLANQVLAWEQSI